MDSMYLYNEAMAKLTEAQICHNEIVKCNAELQKVQTTFYNTFNHIMRIYLNVKHKYLYSHKNKKIKERDDKLNEAISKALEIIEDEVYNNAFSLNSLGAQVAGVIYSYMALHDIRLQYSAEVNTRLLNITTIVSAKGMNDLWLQVQKSSNKV